MPDSLATRFQQLGLSVLLGLLVGLQREHVASKLGRLRTFPLITVLGTLCGLLAESLGGWIVAAGMLGVVTLAAIGRRGRGHQTGANAFRARLDDRLANFVYCLRLALAE